MGDTHVGENTRVVIALIDGEHHPATVREVLDRLDDERALAGVVFCGGEEKVRAGVLEDAESLLTAADDALRLEKAAA